MKRPSQRITSPGSRSATRRSSVSVAASVFSIWPSREPKAPVSTGAAPLQRALRVRALAGVDPFEEGAKLLVLLHDVVPVGRRHDVLGFGEHVPNDHGEPSG